MKHFSLFMELTNQKAARANAQAAGIMRLD